MVKTTWKKPPSDGGWSYYTFILHLLKTNIKYGRIWWESVKVQLRKTGPLSAHLTPDILTPDILTISLFLFVFTITTKENNWKYQMLELLIPLFAISWY